MQNRASRGSGSSRPKSNKSGGQPPKDSKQKTGKDKGPVKIKFNDLLKMKIVGIHPAVFDQWNIVAKLTRRGIMEVEMVERDKPIPSGQGVDELPKLGATVAFFKALRKEQSEAENSSKFNSVIYKIAESLGNNFKPSGKFRNELKKFAPLQKNIAHNRAIVEKMEDSKYRTYCLNSLNIAENKGLEAIQALASGTDTDLLEEMKSQHLSYTFSKLISNKLQIQSSEPAYKIFYPKNFDKQIEVSIDELNDKLKSDSFDEINGSLVWLRRIVNATNVKSLVPTALDQHGHFREGSELDNNVRKFRFPVFDQKLRKDLIMHSTSSELLQKKFNTIDPLYKMEVLKTNLYRMYYGFPGSDFTEDEIKQYWTSFVSGFQPGEVNTVTGSYRNQCVKALKNHELIDLTLLGNNKKILEAHLEAKMIVQSAVDPRPYTKAVAVALHIDNIFEEKFNPKEKTKNLKEVKRFVTEPKPKRFKLTGMPTKAIKGKEAQKNLLKIADNINKYSLSKDRKVQLIDDVKSFAMSFRSEYLRDLALEQMVALSSKTYEEELKEKEAKKAEKKSRISQKNKPELSNKRERKEEKKEEAKAPSSRAASPAQDPEEQQVPAEEEEEPPDEEGGEEEDEEEASDDDLEDQLRKMMTD